MKQIAHFLSIIIITSFSFSQLTSEIDLNSINILGDYSGNPNKDFDSNRLLRSIKAFNYSVNSISKMSLPDKNTSLTRQIPNGQRLFEECSKGVVLLVSENGIGSGSIIDKDGHILTNWHVINGQQKMHVCFFDPSFGSIDDISSDNFTTATVIASDSKRDLAILKLDNKSRNVNYLKKGSIYNIDISMDVFAIGHPEGLIWSFTDGIISRVRKGYKWTYSDNEMKADVIQTQTPINPGNSGGPLFNIKGELIGINSFGKGSSQGLNFAVHLREINQFLKEIDQGKHSYKFVEASTSTEESKYVEIDRDENGIIDCYAESRIGSEKLDVFYLDNNEDGVTDVIVMDSNEDGKIDIRAYDSDENGTFDYFIIDSDYDGVFDTDGFDTNDDGAPDKFKDYTE